MQSCQVCRLLSYRDTEELSLFNPCVGSYKSILLPHMGSASIGTKHLLYIDAARTWRRADGSDARSSMGICMQEQMQGVISLHYCDHTLQVAAPG